MFPSEQGSSSSESVKDFGPPADAVNFPQPGRELPPPVETSTVGVVNRNPGGETFRGNFPPNPVDESPVSGHEDDLTVDVEIVMGTVGIIAIALIGVLTLVVRRMRRQKSSSSDQVNSGKGEVWSTNASKRKREGKQFENGEEYFVDNNYENDSQYQNNDELYENDNQYQNT